MIVKLHDVRIFFPGSGNMLSEAVRDFGEVLGDSIHVDNLKQPESNSINRSQSRIDKVNESLSILDSVEPLDSGVEKDELLKWATKSPEMIIRNILGADEFVEKVSADILSMNNLKRWYDRWSTESNSNDLRRLAKSGVYLKFYTSDKDSLAKIPEDKITQIFEASKGLYLVVLLSCDADDKISELIEDVPPKYSLEYINKFISRKERQLKGAQDLLGSLVDSKEALQQYLSEQEDILLVRETCRGMEQLYDTVHYMKCYVPEAQLAEVKAIADKYSLGISVMAVEGDDDNAPTLLKNPKWVNRIKPVMNFMGLVHGYHEIDLSKIFMIFFTFFTGVLVGDAGYGIIFLLLTLFAHSKSKFKAGIEFSLVYTLSVSVMFWGVITGTYFGSPEIAQIPFLSNLIIEQIASFGGDAVIIQKVMFIIGAVHLTVGHLQKAWRYINSVRPLGEIGWVLIVWSLYFVVAEMVLKIDSPEFLKWMFISGVSLVALFSSSGGGFFKGILSSVGDLPLSVISGFSDIISYIRLYAVGLSTVLMAQSFNEMAIGDGLSSVGAYAGAILILIAGHGLNMALAGMAVIVHGVRLNMLEYAGHAGVEFSGSDYVPLKFKNKNKNKNNNK